MSIGETVDARSSRDERLQLRASERQKALFRSAAAELNKSMTDFLLDAGTAAAENVLADRRFFSISEERWQAFEEALDRPAVLKHSLTELLHEESILQLRSSDET